MTDQARDAAIRALCDFAEQPHPGRAGEAIDAIGEYLRAEQPATETAYEDAGSLVPHAKIPVALEGVRDMDWKPDEPVEGVSDEAMRYRSALEAIATRLIIGEASLAFDGNGFPLVANHALCALLNGDEKKIYEATKELEAVRARRIREEPAK